MTGIVYVDSGLDKETNNGMEKTSDTRFPKQITSDMSLDPFYSKSNLDHVIKGIWQLEDDQGSYRELIEEIG